METNPLLANRVIPLRERVEKTVVSAVIYVGAMVGLYWYHGELPERFSQEFFVGVGISIFLFTFVILSLFKHERAMDKDRARMIRMRIDDDRSGRHWTSRLGLQTKLFLGRAVMLAGIATVLFGVFVLGKQIYVWWRTSSWVPVPTMQFVKPYVTWLFTLDIWLTGQRAVIAALNWLHIAVPLGFIGVFMAARGARFMERAKDKALAARQG